MSTTTEGVFVLASDVSDAGAGERQHASGRAYRGERLVCAQVQLTICCDPRAIEFGLREQA